VNPALISVLVRQHTRKWEVVPCNGEVIFRTAFHDRVLRLRHRATIGRNRQNVAWFLVPEFDASGSVSPAQKMFNWVARYLLPCIDRLPDPTLEVV
jgi:hypothetical protein